jgi:hypothetical protein
MKLEPLQWICDTCGQLIEKSEDGWVEWRENPESFRYSDFRVVHHALASPRQSRGRNCYEHANHAEGHDSHLGALLGVDGMFAMTTWLQSPGVESQKEWAEIFRRLHLPNYESARRYWGIAAADGLFEEVDEEEKYSQEMLKKINSTYGVESVAVNSNEE